MEVYLQVIDNPFFVTPFHVKEEDKTMINGGMQRLEHLDIAKQGMPPYSSHIMLIAIKNSHLKGIIMDFRFFNNRLLSVNLAFPFIRNAFAILGSSKCECLTILYLKDAYHTISYQIVPNLYVACYLILVQLVMYTKDHLWY